jgi:hypothetical protein
MDGSVINKEGIEVIDLFVLKIDEEYFDNQLYLHSSLFVSLIPID